LVIFDSPHRRFDPLRRHWVLVSPQRSGRPWQGQMERTPSETLPTFDPHCYLCPGNERAGGIKNESYDGTYVFDNDFPALITKRESQTGQNSSHPLLTATPEEGICRVVCFSPRHDLSLPELELREVESVVSTWVKQTAELGALPFINNVQVFENKGELMGCSNPHPPSQIWAQSQLPNEIAIEAETQTDYWNQHHSNMLLDYASEERRLKERVIADNHAFLALVPFWAVWPFEVLIIAMGGSRNLVELAPDEIPKLADILKQVTTRYDNLFQIPFPYSMGFHQSPFDGGAHPGWSLHMHFYPPLLRSATVRKFMVGYEMLAMPQRDITAESAAERLRTVPELHYKQSKVGA
jgi:UDPglucose--hexose-1-phosphate uridylyltransferase